MWQYYKAAINSDTSSNGGAMSNKSTSPFLFEDVFPGYSEEERQTGATRSRKLFYKFVNDTEGTKGRNTASFVKQPSSGEDYLYVAVGSLTDTQGDIGSYSFLGSGFLSGSITGNVSTCLVVTGARSDMFATTGTILVGTIAAGGDAISPFERLTLSAANYAGGTWTLSISGDGNENGGGTVLHSYAGGALVSSLVSHGDVYAYVDNYSTNSVGGSFNDDAEARNIGTIDDSWTLEFLDANQVSAYGSSAGTLGTYYISADIAPENPLNGSYYFYINANSFSGTFAGGDTVTFDTNSATCAVWIKGVCLSGAAGNGSVVAFVGPVYES